jgi:hypothetical protein
MFFRKAHASHNPVCMPLSKVLDAQLILQSQFYSASFAVEVPLSYTKAARTNGGDIDF